MINRLSLLVVVVLLLSLAAYVLFNRTPIIAKILLGLALLLFVLIIIAIFSINM